MEREIYVRLAVELATQAEAQAALDDANEARYVEHALLRAKQYAHLAAKIWGKE